MILIDTDAGNGKERTGLQVFDHLHTPCPARLEAAGVPPEDVTHVLLTRVHANHVGWNTLAILRDLWRVNSHVSTIAYDVLGVTDPLKSQEEPPTEMAVEGTDKR